MERSSTPSLSKSKPLTTLPPRSPSSSSPQMVASASFSSIVPLSGP